MTPLNAGAPEALTSLATEHRKSDRMLEEYSVNRCKYSKEHSVGKRLITLEVLPTIGRQDCFNFRIVLVLELTTSAPPVSEEFVHVKTRRALSCYS